MSGSTRWRGGILFPRLIRFYEEEDERWRENKREREGGKSRERERERERRKIEGNRRRFILKSGLLLSGEGEGITARRTEKAEAAILPQSVQYGYLSANCFPLPIEPNKGRRGRREEEPCLDQKTSNNNRGRESEEYSIWFWSKIRSE